MARGGLARADGVNIVARLVAPGRSMRLVPSQLAGLPAQRHPTADSTEAVAAGLLASVGGASDRPRGQLPACCPSTSPGRSEAATMPP